jgi:hypothetical protein
MLSRRVLLAILGLLAIAGLAVIAAPAAAQTPMCPPTRFVDLGPPPAGTDTDSPEPGTDTGPSTGEPPAVTAPPACRPFVKRLMYPLLTHELPDSLFGAVRDGGQRWHAGTDILVPQLTPVVAAADGVISTIVATTESMWVGIRHFDGWSTMYVHLNNDTYLTDDGQGIGVRGDLVVGSEVEAGTVIGWVGDSGNAEPGPAHLHFELRDPSSTPVDAYASLIAATRRYDSLPPFTGAFADDEGVPSESLFNHAVSIGVPVWCGDQGLYACPTDVATRKSLADWTRVLLPDRYGAVVEYFLASTQHEFLSNESDPNLLRECANPLVCEQPITGWDVTDALGVGVVTDGTCGKPIGDRVLSRATVLRNLFELAFPRTDPPCAIIT